MKRRDVRVRRASDAAGKGERRGWDRKGTRGSKGGGMPPEELRDRADARIGAKMRRCGGGKKRGLRSPGQSMA